MLKLELYGQLSLDRPVDGEDYPEGYVFLPDGTSDEWIKQLVAEELRITKLRTGGFKREWHKVRDRNEALDNAVYARAVAIGIGVDRLTPRQWEKLLGDRAIKPPTPVSTEATERPPVELLPATQARSPVRRPKRPNPYTSRRR